MARATTEDHDLSERLRSGLEDPGVPLWLPELTDEIAETGWRTLHRDLGIDRASYGTARVLGRDHRGPRLVSAVIAGPAPEGAPEGGVPVELLPRDLLSQIAGPDVRLFDGDEVFTTGALSCVEQSFDLLAVVPTVRETVQSFIRSLHLIDTGDDEVDASFSDPNLPFSAFVSVPSSDATVGPLRVAEALLHEAMHLQLTLVEGIVPLVSDTESTYFSPWRGEFRTAQGVLHALFVFSAIGSYLGAFPAPGGPLTPVQAHLNLRRSTIAAQVCEIRHFGDCPALTPDGAMFVNRLLASNMGP